MVDTGRALDELAASMQRYPQILLNVGVAERVNPRSDERVCAVVEEVERELGAGGRVLLRASGTEPLVRAG